MYLLVFLNRYITSLRRTLCTSECSFFTRTFRNILFRYVYRNTFIFEIVCIPKNVTFVADFSRSHPTGPGRMGPGPKNHTFSCSAVDLSVPVQHLVGIHTYSVCIACKSSRACAYTCACDEKRIGGEPAVNGFRDRRPRRTRTCLPHPSSAGISSSRWILISFVFLSLLTGFSSWR